METQKIVNLLNGSDNESLKFPAKHWHVISDQNNSEYGEGSKDDSSINYETKVIKLSL